jgi:hypothetical protein
LAKNGLGTNGKNGQGVQMSWLKNRPKCSEAPVLSKLMHNLKYSPTMRATYVIFQQQSPIAPTAMQF